MHPLLLTGPPAAGKSTTARAVAALRPRAAVIDVDDIRHLVVSGHAAPWQGDEGRLQQRVGVENACDLAQRLESVEFDVVLADVVDPGTIGLYRSRLPRLVVINLRLSSTEARRRAATRPWHLTAEEFERLYAQTQREDVGVDTVLDVDSLTPEEQTAAVLSAWRSQ